MHVYRNIDINMCIYIYVYVQIYRYIDTLIYRYIYTDIDTDMDIGIDTDTSIILNANINMIINVDFRSAFFRPLPRLSKYHLLVRAQGTLTSEPKPCKGEQGRLALLV